MSKFKWEINHVAGSGYVVDWLCCYVLQQMIKKYETIQYAYTLLTFRFN